MARNSEVTAMEAPATGPCAEQTPNSVGLLAFGTGWPLTFQEIPATAAKPHRCRCSVTSSTDLNLEHFSTFEKPHDSQLTSPSSPAHTDTMRPTQTLRAGGGGAPIGMYNV